MSSYQSPVGIALSGFVWIVYAIALRFEGPFTDKIYSAKHKKATVSVPTTPSRKSARIASHNASASEKEDGPASVAATPRTRRKVSELRAVDSPARATRSRSKGRMSGSEAE